MNKINEENIIPKKIKKVFLIPNSFFIEPDYKNRFDKEIKKLRNRINIDEKEKIKDDLNFFYFACINSITDKKLKLYIHLEFLETLNIYAQKFSSKETYQNIISVFENKDLKNDIFSKYPTESKLVYATSLFQYYNLIKNDKPFYSETKTELLLKSKYYLWKIYISHIEGYAKINNKELSHILTILAGCLAELSRWFEPLYFLNIAKENLKTNPNVEYLRALLLDAIKDKTCLNYNELLLLKIIDSSNESIKYPNILLQQKEQLEKIKKNCGKILKVRDKSIHELRIHKNKISDNFNKYNDYKKFCIENQLFLNEHSFFCNCTEATKDNISVKTNHTHTSNEWSKQYETLIDIITFDFIVARKNYYDSFDSKKITNFRIKQIARNKTTKNIKNALLKSSFKAIYSILDQISFGIFKVYNIDYEKILKKKYGDNIPKLTFLNMWEHELFTSEDFENNYYLISLQSISKDLDRTPYSALKKFKDIRNAL